MNQTKTIILACVLGILCLGGGASLHACKCVTRTLTYYFVESPFVFAAVVKSYKGDSTILQVTKIWKGQISQQVIITQTRSSCDFYFREDVEYAVFASHPLSTDKTISGDKMILFTHQCLGNCELIEIGTIALDSLTSLSSFMYEFQKTGNRAEYRTILFSPEHGVKLNNRTISQTGIFNIYGQRIPILPNLDSKAIRMEVNKTLLSNSWYLLRYHTDAGVFILPFVYYEDRFYNADKQMTWK
jgi:hypothetical protein